MLEISELLRGALAAGSDEEARDGARGRRARGRVGPSHVVFSLTHHCNAGCAHCYATPSARSSPLELTTAEVLRILDELKGAGVTAVTFSGGEPLLRGDLLPIIEETHALGLEPRLWTNGLLLSDATAARLQLSGLSYVGVNVDGGRAGATDWRRVYERAGGAVRAGAQAGLRTGLHVTLLRDHAGALEALHRVAHEAGAVRLHISHFVNLKARQGAELSREERRLCFEQLFLLAEHHLGDSGAPAIVSEGNESDGPLLLLWVEARHGVSAARHVERRLREGGGNLAGEDVLAIDPRGRVHPDPTWPHAVLGDLRKQSFREALAHPLREELQRRSARLHGRCGSCRYLSLCRGAHRERAILTHGNLWAPDPACLLLDDEVGAPGEELMERDATA